MKLSDNVRAVIIITLIFLPMAVIGTICHELGHMVVARGLDRHPVLHYGSTSWDDDSVSSMLDANVWRLRLAEELGTNDPHPPPVEKSAANRITRQSILELSGGPLSNMLIGTIGLVWLWLLRRRSQEWNVPKWIALMLMLFWSRQAFVMITAVVRYVATQGMPLHTDELRLAVYMGLPLWSVLIVTGVAGMAICITALRWFPAGRRTHLAIGGVAGSLAGFGLWYGLLGPLILP